jgi:hypothetical protein
MHCLYPIWGPVIFKGGNIQILQSLISIMLKSRSVFKLIHLQDPGQYDVSLERLLY